MGEGNEALWRMKRGGPFVVGPAERTAAGPNEIVVRVRAVGVNPVDGMPAIGYRVALPWLRFPAIIGSDVAGDVVEVGAGVTRFRPGDRVLGHAFGVEKSQNRPAEGAFQRYVVLLEHMAAPLPDSLPFQRAAVLPLTLSTAATALFQQDHLGLPLPTVTPVERGETVLVWGGSTGVGSNSIQLARSTGYRVVATASAHNFEYVRSLGASGVFDRRDPSAVDAIVQWMGDGILRGSFAIGAGSLRKVIAIAALTNGSKRVVSAQTEGLARLQSLGARRHGVQVSGIWGGTLKDNEVGPAVYRDFLPGALATGAYRAAPDPIVVGEGLHRIPEALERLRGGVSAGKFVVTL